MGLTVGKLIDELRTYPAEWNVLLSSDEEGNSYHEVWDVSEGTGRPLHHEWEVKPTLDFILSEQGQAEEWEVHEDDVRVVVIYP